VELLISNARIFFGNHSFDWSVCGGGAIDLFLGKQTRIHKDLDIAVYWEDRNSIIAFQIPFEKRNLFCFTAKEYRCRLEPYGDDMYRFSFEKKEQNDFTYVEFLFNQRDDEYFYLPGDGNVKRNLNNALLESNGVPYLAPEIVLFYKSSYLEGLDTFDHNQDFDHTLPFLDEEQKQWLRASLEKKYTNGHVWLQRV